MFQSGQYQQTLVAVLYSPPELQVPAQRPFLLEPAFGGGRIRCPWIVPSKPFAHVLMIDCQSIFYWCGCCKKNQVKNQNTNAVAVELRAQKRGALEVVSEGRVLVPIP